jgi:hypothetical protein
MPLSSKAKRWLVAVVVIAPLTLLVAHLSIANSDAFETASGFLRTHSTVQRLAGNVRATSLSWRGGALRFSGDSGSANFTVIVEGEVASLRSYVELKKRGIWEVTFVRLLPENGAPIELEAGK